MQFSNNKSAPANPAAPSGSIEDEIKKDLENFEHEAVADAEQVEKEYVHIPGTTHLNAYIAEVAELEKKVAGAMGELGAAKERLHNKKVESGMIQ